MLVYCKFLLLEVGFSKGDGMHSDCQCHHITRNVLVSSTYVNIYSKYKHIYHAHMCQSIYQVGSIHQKLLVANVFNIVLQDQSYINLIIFLLPYDFICLMIEARFCHSAILCSLNPNSSSTEGFPPKRKALYKK